MSGGDISAIYIGERFRAIPIANPPAILNRLYCQNSALNAVPSADTANRKPEKISRRRLPYLSAVRKQKTAPKMHPTSAELVPQPFKCAEVRPKYGS